MVPPYRVTERPRPGHAERDSRASLWSLPWEPAHRTPLRTGVSRMETTDAWRRVNTQTLDGHGTVRYSPPSRWAPSIEPLSRVRRLGRISGVGPSVPARLLTPLPSTIRPSTGSGCRHA